MKNSTEILQYATCETLNIRLGKKLEISVCVCVNGALENDQSNHHYIEKTFMAPSVWPKMRIQTD